MDDAHDGRRCLAAIDLSKLIRGRSRKLRAETRATRERSRELRGHEWRAIAVGRVCEACSLSQAEGEFDDEPLCAAS